MSVPMVFLNGEMFGQGRMGVEEIIMIEATMLWQ